MLLLSYTWYVGVSPWCQCARSAERGGLEAFPLSQEPGLLFSAEWNWDLTPSTGRPRWPYTHGLYPAPFCPSLTLALSTFCFNNEKLYSRTYQGHCTAHSTRTGCWVRVFIIASLVSASECPKFVLVLGGIKRSCPFPLSIFLHWEKKITLLFKIYFRARCGGTWL